MYNHMGFVYIGFPVHSCIIGLLFDLGDLIVGLGKNQEPLNRKNVLLMIIIVNPLLKYKPIFIIPCKARDTTSFMNISKVKDIIFLLFYFYK